MSRAIALKALGKTAVLDCRAANMAYSITKTSFHGHESRSQRQEHNSMICCVIVGVYSGR
jgi:hypothetical protein